MSIAQYGTICQNSGCIRNAEFLSVIPTILVHEKTSDIAKEKCRDLSFLAIMHVISELGADAIDSQKTGSSFLCDRAASVLVPLPVTGKNITSRKICARVVVCSHSAVHVSCPLKRKDLSISKEDMEMFQKDPDRYLDLVIDTLRTMFKNSELREKFRKASASSFPQAYNENIVPENPAPNKKAE